MAPSVIAATRCKKSKSSTVPIWTRAPASVSFFPDALDRASPVTWWPAAMSSLTIANPMNPVAPVTKTRIFVSGNTGRSAALMRAAIDVTE
jgi:hypothetical protein